MLLTLFEEEQESSSDSIRQLLDSKSTEFAKSLINRIEKRLEKLETQIECIGETIASQNETFGSWIGNGQASSEAVAAETDHHRDLADKLDLVAERFSDKTDIITGVFKSQIEQMFEDLRSKATHTPESIGKPKQIKIEAQPQATAPLESASHWHKQKEAMLSKYGIDPDYRPVMELQDSLGSDATVAVPELTAFEREPATPTNSMPEADAAFIKELKEKLNDKLREAELELSISRAKIAQQKALFDEQQVELERRSKMIEEKFAAIKNAPKRRMGFFKWIWHHLKPKPPAVNDRK